MSTISLDDLNQEQLKNHLKTILKANSISDFTIHPSAVNTTLQFEADEKKYIIKLMTTPTTDEWGKYRFEKVGKLFEQFATNPIIPTPQVIRVETSEEPLGYRYIIMTFVEGENLWSIWRQLTQKDIIPIVKELAGIVRAIHEVKFDFWGDIEDCEASTRYSNYKQMRFTYFEELTQTILERKILPKDLVKKANSFFMDNFDKTNQPKKASLIHNDIHQGNIIVKKNPKGIYKIQAILDWEWACADNSLEDIVYIESVVLLNQETKKIFFKEYFQGERDSLSDFVLDITLFQIMWIFDDVVHGLLHHNPTPENIENAKNDLERLLKGM
ncbi:MAG: aminoglycoside phosphotransferase family protein [Candidatus Heimdallarchaeota archaeon]